MISVSWNCSHGRKAFHRYKVHSQRELPDDMPGYLRELLQGSTRQFDMHTRSVPLFGEQSSPQSEPRGVCQRLAVKLRAAVRGRPSASTAWFDGGTSSFAREKALNCKSADRSYCGYTEEGCVAELSVSSVRKGTGLGVRRVPRTPPIACSHRRHGPPAGIDRIQERSGREHKCHDSQKQLCKGSLAHAILPSVNGLFGSAAPCFMPSSRQTVLALLRSAARCSLPACIVVRPHARRSEYQTLQ
jgi:hypothetical protein